MEADRLALGNARIEFAGRTARLTRADTAILDDVAALLTSERWEDIRIRVEVHIALGTGSESKARIRRQKRRDRRLSRRRARAIRGYLVSVGKVASGRVQAVGLGSERPIAQPRTDSRNERVVFIRSEQR